MALAPGTRIGSFEILAPLGSGGMGEVYQARDLRLARAVAIKALPEAFARDPERQARFDREARLLASLNHPNIAAIYGLEEVEGSRFLVLEYIGGETLASRLARGPLSVREALDVAIQIGSGIEAAHEAGIVHRDLKPGNVMLAPSGSVKVLDFGLAKTGPAANPAQDSSHVSTAELSRTEQGLVLGTAPYMSPEQARGEPVDRRADVWAFGCVLFECLTGRRAFGAATVAEVLARILERAPDWSALPDAVPPRLRELVQRCLIKEARERPRDIGDLRRALGEIAAGGASAASFAMGGSTTAPSLAVLYFENLGNDPEGEYFCAGVTEDILTDLSRLTGMRVASRNAVARYRGTQVAIPQVGADLGVNAVLEGSVRRADDRVRITVQLVDARDGFQLWAARYDRTLHDVFAVQEEIAASIASAMSVVLTPSESSNLVRDRPRDVRAYDLYLKGRAKYAGFTLALMREAMELFRQAVTIDPHYALAWAGIADCHGQFVQWGAAQPDEQIRLGLEAARRAIEIAPRLAEAHKAYALVLKFSGDSAGAVAALRTAIEMNPRYVPALGNLSVTLFDHADVAGAERLNRRTVEIDPQGPFQSALFAERLWITGRLEEARAATDHLRSITSEPAFITFCWVTRAWIQIARRDLAAASQVLRDGLDDGAAPLNLRAVEPLIAVLKGQREEACERLKDLEGEGALHPIAPTVLALVAACAQVGDFGAALRWADRPVVRFQMQTFARLIPELHPLLDHPAFAPRCRDVTLVWPLEAPMIDAARRALFQEVRIESGILQGTDPLGRGS